MKLDIDFLRQAYFYFDKPVPWEVETGSINIAPIMLEDSLIFIASADILAIDKNSLPDVAIIQMSYLEFIVQILFAQDELNYQKFLNLLRYCLGIEAPVLITYKGKMAISDTERSVIITAKQFDDIRRVILYQNFPRYDDRYINPDVKNAMNEVDSLRSRRYAPISIERKMAIISSHTGISKQEQLKMTLRSHTMLFEEVRGEVEYTTLFPVLAFSGHADKMENWIDKKKKDEFDGYFTTVNNFSKSMGNSNG